LGSTRHCNGARKAISSRKPRSGGLAAAWQASRPTKTADNTGTEGWRKNQRSDHNPAAGTHPARQSRNMDLATTQEHTMGMMQEFKEFAVKGSVVDLAVGVIIGAAFSKIVDSVVSDLILPLVGAVIGKIDFSNLFIVLGSVPAGTATTLDALKKAGVPVFAYGNFITVAVNFAILAFIIFLMIKQINRLKKETPVAPPAPAATPEDVVLLREIRDSLRK
jgi:large conductance mechanosensitive channel